MSRQQIQKIKFKYEITVQTDTLFKASLYQKFIELAMLSIKNYFKGKTNKVETKLVGKNYKDDENF